MYIKTSLLLYYVLVKYYEYYEYYERYEFRDRFYYTNNSLSLKTYFWMVL